MPALSVAATLTVLAPVPAALAAEKQTIEFTSTPPNPGLVGDTYSVTAKATSGLTVSFASTTPTICTVSGSTVEFIAAGGCNIEATQPGNEQWEAAPAQTQPVTVVKRAQSITITSKPPSPGAVGGLYTAEATASSHLPVSFSSTTPAICTISGSTVKLVASGTCKIEATQLGNGEWEAAPGQGQEFNVVTRTQTVSFTSAPPSGASVGGSSAVSATASSGLPVSYSSASPSICSMSAHTVSFLAPGTCTIVATQSGSTEYGEAQAQQSFAVLAPPVTSGIPPPATVSRVTVVVVPDSTFKVLGATLNLRSYWITFTETVHDPGTFTWVLTFKNGPFGAYAAGAKACRAGRVRLKGRCRPSRVMFAKGSQYVPAPGNASFTVVPTAAGVSALKKAFKRKTSLPVRAVVIFQSVHGGQSVTHIQKLVVKLRR